MIVLSLYSFVNFFGWHRCFSCLRPNLGERSEQLCNSEQQQMQAATFAAAVPVVTRQP